MNNISTVTRDLYPVQARYQRETVFSLPWTFLDTEAALAAATTTTIIIKIAIIIIVIMIRTLKRAIRDLLKSPHCAANCVQYVRSSDQRAFVCKYRANTSGACHVLQRANMCATW